MAGSFTNLWTISIFSIDNYYFMYLNKLVVCYKCSLLCRIHTCRPYFKFLIARCDLKLRFLSHLIPSLCFFLFFNDQDQITGNFLVSESWRAENSNMLIPSYRWPTFERYIYVESVEPRFSFIHDDSLIAWFASVDCFFSLTFSWR